MSVVEAEKKEESPEKGGELLFCGATNWDMIGRKKTPADTNLVSPTRLRPLLGIDIRFVAAGCIACHCVALDVEGRCYTWGRNDKGQLGHGDMIQRDRPTVVSGLAKHKIVTAGSGRSHTVVVTEDGTSLSFGWNKHGQLGTGSTKNVGSEIPENNTAVATKVTKKGGAKTAEISNKRKSKESSESEDEDNNSDDNNSDDGSDDSERMNGRAKGKKLRGGKASGRGRGTNSSGRGRGRPPAEKGSQSAAGKTGKRVRPRKA